jgi:ketosteroid isomerase-like protein
MDTIEKALADIEKSMVKLFNKKEIDKILKYFSQNFIGFSSTKHDRITQLSQLKKTFLYYLTGGDKVKYSIRNLKVKIYGELALTTFYWRVDIQKKQKTKAVEGRGSHLFLLIDTDWKIVHEHFSKAH